jgi:hypothetical protein
MIENKKEFSLMYEGIFYLERKKSWISTYEVEFHDVELPKIKKLTGQFDPIYF